MDTAISKSSNNQIEQISYAKTVYGQQEIDAVVKCLSEFYANGELFETI